MIAACLSLMRSGRLTGRNLEIARNNVAAAYGYRALGWLKKGDRERALADLNEAIRMNSRDNVIAGIVYAQRGDIWQAGGERERAISDFGQAILRNPTGAHAYKARGDAYAGKSDYNRAIADYGQAIRLDPKGDQVYFARALAYESKGEFDHAVADYTMAIELNPDEAGALINRAIIYGKQHQYDRAISEFDQIFALDQKRKMLSTTGKVIAYTRRGMNYLWKEEYNRASADLDEAIRLDPSSVDALRTRGYMFERRGDVVRARADYDAVLAENPDEKFAKEGLARLAHAGSTPVETPAAGVNTALAPASCSALGKRVALVVGNSAYAGAARLVNPTNDADDVSALLRDKLCFTVIEAKDATHETFSRRIGEFAEAASSADVALFYYAGHGAQFQNANYLLPVDSKMANEYDAIHGNISAQDMIATIETRAKATLVFLDACRENPIEENFRRRMASAGRGFGETRGLAPMMGRSSETLVVFATRPNERAADGAGRNSPFTEAFLQHIATPGKDIELVMRDVAASVRTKTNGRQIPQRLTELEHGLMLLPGR